MRAAGLSAAAMERAYAHAPDLWYTFAGIGFAAFAALLVFRWVTGRLDRGRRAKGLGVPKTGLRVRRGLA